MIFLGHRVSVSNKKSDDFKILLYYFVQVRPDLKPVYKFDVLMKRWLSTLRTPESIGMSIK